LQPIPIPFSEIVAYWETRQDEGGLAVDWAEAHQRCWRCGYRATLHHCHIVPECRGGAYTAENLVLLCGRCHREAPNVSDPRFMWIWLRATCIPFYDLYWTARGAEEFEEMFGRPPFTGEAFAKASQAQVEQLLNEEIKRATIHWGEGRMNPSTIASIFALVEEQMGGLPIAAPDCSARALKLLKATGLVKKESAKP
jgi:hypothetical protein